MDMQNLIYSVYVLISNMYLYIMYTYKNCYIRNVKIAEFLTTKQKLSNEMVI